MRWAEHVEEFMLPSLNRHENSSHRGLSRFIFRAAQRCLIGSLFVLSLAAHAAAKTEHCMLDGDEVRESFFATPTTDTREVTVRIEGHTYKIPRTYFGYPKLECRTGNSRSFLLRMTWPDLAPAVDSRSRSFVQVLVSARIVRDLSYHMRNATKFELSDAVEPIEGLSGFASGMTQAEKKIRDHYYAPSRTNPEIFVSCTPYGQSPGQTCQMLVPYRDAVARILIRRSDMPRWKEIVESLKRKLDAFIVK